jgi:hypothetical protein
VKPDPLIVIAGSRALPTGQAPRLLISFLAALPPASVILLRRGVFTGPNLFEAQVEWLCDLLGLTMEWRQPVPVKRQLVAGNGRDRVVVAEDEVLGREATWDRDVAMCADADLVLCFFPLRQVGDMTSGTVALVEKAIELDTPVYAYALDALTVTRVGEHDPEDLWSKQVPRPQ